MVCVRHLLFALTVFLVSSNIMPGTEAQLVETTLGKVQGFQETVDVNGEVMVISKFLGIPYAKPPVGDLRLEKPEELEPWDATVDATDYPAQCIQLDDQLRSKFPSADRATLNEIAKSYGRTYPSEDCLYLNVYVPREAISSADSLSVMVWIHDGGFIVYSANVNEGTELALEGDIIVVTINYRLTGLGWLTVENATDIVRANLGFADQVLALQWVRDNIVNFGGNPDDVTIAGTSAGATSVLTHAVSPKSRGLFHRLISTSGSPNHVPWSQSDVHRAYSRQFIASEGCSNEDADTVLKCLKDLPVEAFSGVPKSMLLLPIVDFEYIPAEAEYLLKTGQIHSVKQAILGSTNAEGSLVLNPDHYGVMNEDLLKQLLSQFAYLYCKDDPERIASLWWYEYLPETDSLEDYQTAYDEIHSDMMLSTTVRNLEYMNEAGLEKVYQYFYTHRSSDSAWPEGVDASHGSDVKFTLPRHNSLARATPEELALGKMWRQAWSNFVKTGDPNPISDDPDFVWEPYTADSKTYLEMDTGMTAENVKENISERRMKLWNDVIYRLADKPWEEDGNECPGSESNGEEENPEVEVEQGKLRGKQLTKNGQRWEEYLGIPYAVPPTGSLRWKKPQPLQPWEDTRDATQFGPACPQNDESRRYSQFGLSEDCLYLNVYVPSGVNYVRYLGLPVMVFIHGGVFYEGASSSYPGHTLALHGSVIVVTINYRLGAFGFITTLDQEAPGNYGLWDQNLAMKWVKKNIGHFGGDTERITIFGQSAGGCSVSLHMLSPHSEGLFQGVIAQSATAFTPFNLRDGSDLLALTHDMANHFNCPTNSTTLMMNCLRQLDMEVLTAATNINNFWSPVLDGDFFPIDLVANDAFASIDHSSLSIPMLVGSLHHDGASAAGYGALVQTPESWRLTIHGRLIQTLYRNPEAVAAAADYVYLDNGVKDDVDLMKMAGIELLTDALYRAPTVMSAREYSRIGGKTYLYSMRHHSSASIAPAYIEGVHSDDVYYVLGMQQEWSMTPSEVKLSEDIMTYWTNFAHSGDPNKPVPVSVEWPQFSIDSHEYIELGVDTTVRDSFDRPRQLTFWMDVVPAMEGSTTCAPVPPPNDGSGDGSNHGNGNKGNGDKGTGGKGTDDKTEDGDDCDDDDDDDDDLKRVVIISACLAGGSVLLGLVMLCCICNIKAMLFPSGKAYVA